MQDFDRNARRVAQGTMKMPAPMQGVMGGPVESELREMLSTCSYCREEGLNEFQCVRGDCFDGCGDCAALGDQ